MSKTAAVEDRLLSDRDVAALYGVHPQTVRAWSALGRIPKPVQKSHKFVRWSAIQIQEDIRKIREAENQEAAS